MTEIMWVVASVSAIQGLLILWAIFRLLRQRRVLDYMVKFNSATVLMLNQKLSAMEHNRKPSSYDRGRSAGIKEALKTVVKHKRG